MKNACIFAIQLLDVLGGALRSASARSRRNPQALVISFSGSSHSVEAPAQKTDSAYVLSGTTPAECIDKGGGRAWIELRQAQPLAPGSQNGLAAEPGMRDDDDTVSVPAKKD